jgi:hypothetical protein
MNRPSLFAVCLFALLLVGCSASAPRQIASYPSEPRQVAREPANLLTIYNASLVMETSHAQSAAVEANRIVDDLGGYQVTNQSWSSTSRDFVTLELAVPSYRFEDLRRSILSLGRLVSERIVMDRTRESTAGRMAYSHLTIQFQSTRPSVPAYQRPTWYPWNAFHQAFSVLSSIFTFLLYILIWLLVLGLPVVLIILTIRFLVKRWNRSKY